MHLLEILTQKKIMKIMKNSYLALLLLMLGTLSFTACSDEANDEATVPSAVDPKQWSLDENMDTSVKPGDDFARYCWGKWYDTVGDPEVLGNLGSIYEADAAVNKNKEKLEDKEKKQIDEDIDKFEENKDGIADLREYIAKLNAMAQNPNAVEVAKELGAFIASGRASTLSCGLNNSSENCKFDFPASSANYLSKIDTTYIYAWLCELGLGEEEAKLVAKDGMAQGFQDEQPSYEEHDNQQIWNAFCQAFGVSQEYFSSNEGSYIANNMKHIVHMMMCSVASDLPMVSRNAFERIAYDMNFYDYVVNATEGLLEYPRSKEYCEKYCTAEMRDKALSMMEDLRTTFAQRIDSLDWMSNTTKQAAKEKLAAMKFFALYPDSWISEGLPQLKGNSLYEDMQILRKTKQNLNKELVKRNPREEPFNFDFAGFDPAYTVNCYYAQNLNVACIFAPFLAAPYYSSENSDATLYAIGAVMGHEITHGFDDEGADYGPKGEMTNWWTVSDKQDFEERTQLLVDCYNHLPLYMECPSSKYTDGKKTLSENIADLGGLEIALQAYTNKLKQQGFYGDELKKQQRRFFQAYANLWRSKMTEEANQPRQEDGHANFYTRVIGSTMNCNLWYDLYNVQWGDKYYLRPEKRAHIW